MAQRRCLPQTALSDSYPYRQELSTTEAEQLCALLDEAVAVEERKAADALRQFVLLFPHQR